MKRKKLFLTCITCISILVAVYIVTDVMIGYQRDKLRAEVQSKLITSEAKLEGGLNSRLFLEKGLNAFVLTRLSINPSHHITQQEIDEFGEQFMPQLLGIRNITLIQNNIITHVYPLAGNETAIGVDFSSLPNQQAEVLKVAETRQSILTGPIELVQGGLGIIHRSPVYWKPQGAKEPLYWGQSSLVLMMDDLFKEAGLYDLQGLSVAVRRHSEEGMNSEVFWGEEKVFDLDPVIINMKISDGYWQLAAVPVEGWSKANLQIYWLVFWGCIFALCGSALVWFLLSSIETRNQLKYISFHDGLTGLYNRSYFEDAIRNIKTNDNDISLLICDLDGLKMINDTFGHNRGDQVLIQASALLKDCFTKSDIVARIGGDEFAVLLKDVTKLQVKGVKETILQKIDSYNNSQEIPLSLSIGYATSDGCKSVRDLYIEADNNMYREKLYQKQSTRSTIVQTVLKLLETRDFITEEHANRLQDMVSLLGKAVDLPEFRLVDLRLLAQFHDIGKVGIPDSILLKPEKLTVEETLEMRRHSDIGYRLALQAADLAPIAEYILKHHEHWDGSGYPLGLAGENIPLECRILAIADAYDAMTNDRPYRQAMPHAAAMKELKRNAGTQFDPVLVAKFCQIINNDF